MKNVDDRNDKSPNIANKHVSSAVRISLLWSKTPHINNTNILPHLFVLSHIHKNDMNEFRWNDMMKDSY